MFEYGVAGTEHPDRNAQFEHLDRAVQLQLSLGEPVISVDTKKKELVGPGSRSAVENRVPSSSIARPNWVGVPAG